MITDKDLIRDLDVIRPATGWVAVIGLAERVMTTSRDPYRAHALLGALRAGYQIATDPAYGSDREQLAITGVIRALERHLERFAAGADQLLDEMTAEIRERNEVSQ